MKIILTQAEAIQKLKDSVFNESDIVIDIEFPFRATTYDELKPFPIFGALKAVLRVENYSTTGKINAIIALRTFVKAEGFYVGLAEAKAFVEAL